MQILCFDLIFDVSIFDFYLSNINRMSQSNRFVTFLPFDESGTLTGLLGRLSGGSSYDRSIYNELFNGGGTFSCVLSKISYTIVNPRLNFCFFGHVNEFITVMSGLFILLGAL